MMVCEFDSNTVRLKLLNPLYENSIGNSFYSAPVAVAAWQ